MDARTGVRTLERLVLNYCTHSGSSKGFRTFLETHLPKLKGEYPHLDIQVQVKSGYHPYLEGTYKNGRVKAIGVKNEGPDTIHEYAQFLADQWGGAKLKHNGKRQFTQTPSVQGTWTPYLNRPSTPPAPAAKK